MKPSYQTTLLVRDCCLCLHVQRAARALARRFDEALRPLDLTNGQFSLLMSLNRPEPPKMAAVASLLAMISHQQGAAAGLRQKNLILCEAKPAHIARLKQPCLRTKIEHYLTNGKKLLLDFRLSEARTAYKLAAH